MKRKIVIIAVSLLVVLLLTFVLVGGSVFASNPQPEPPVKLANQFNAINSQLQGIQERLTRTLIEPTDEGKEGFAQLQSIYETADGIAAFAREMGAVGR
jgi:hypothetical protein